MSSEVRVREEDGFMVFEKDKMDDLEAKFFNPEYFRMIGFADAEISMINKETGDLIPPDDSGSSGVETDGSTEQVEPSDTDQSGQEPAGSDATDQSGQEPAGSDATDQSVQEPAGSDATDQSVQEPAGSDATDQSGQEPAGSDATDQSVQEPAGSDATDQSVQEPESNASTQPPPGMKGGYYKDVDSLTEPFKHFVYLVQRDRPYYSTKEVSSTTESGTGIYGKLFGETKSSDPSTGSGFASGFQSFFDRIRNALSPSETDASAEKEGTEEEKEPATSPMSISWIVKIPIIRDDVELSKYKKDEILLGQLVREYRAEKVNNIIVEGERHEIGNRSVKMLASVKEGEPVIQYPETKLQGSKMYKMSLLGSGKSKSSWFF